MQLTKKHKTHKHKHNKSTHSDMDPVWQNPIERTVRTAHLSVLMTVHSFSTQYNTEVGVCHFIVIWLLGCHNLINLLIKRLPSGRLLHSRRRATKDMGQCRGTCVNNLPRVLRVKWPGVKHMTSRLPVLHPHQGRFDLRCIVSVLFCVTDCWFCCRGLTATIINEYYSYCQLLYYHM